MDGSDPIIILDGSAADTPVRYVNAAFEQWAGPGPWVSQPASKIGLGMLTDPCELRIGQGQLRLRAAACPSESAPYVWVLAGGSSAPGFVEHLPIAIVIYDSDDRFLWCNQTYRTIIGANAHLLRVGDRFSDIMASAYRAGHYGGDQDISAAIADRLRKHQNHESFDEPLSDGRTLRTSEIALADGGTLGVRVVKTQ